MILLVLLAMGILGWYTIDSTRNTQINHLQSQLVNEAKLTADISAPGFADPVAKDNLTTLANTIGNEISTRITFISGWNRPRR